MLITIKIDVYAPKSWRYKAFWGEDFSDADFWGTGPTVVEAVRDLLDNYDIPGFPNANV